MAKKREPVKPVEPQSESSEEDEVSESESEQPAATQKKSKPQQVTPPPQQPEEEEEEEEETGSEFESESESDVANVVKPLTLSNGAKKTASKPKAPEPEAPAPTKPSSSAKRPAQDSARATTDAKKKKTAELETAEKKSQRLWTEDDEIVILEGLIDFESKKKSDPNLNSFYDFVKKNLHADFTKTQLQDKVRSLKRKFENNQNKEKRVFSKPHEESAYDLSKKIWSNETVIETPKANGSAQSRKTASKKVNRIEAEPVKVVGTEKVKFDSSILGHSSEEHMLATGRLLFESGRGLDGESEWNDLRMEDLKLFQRRLEVRLGQTKLVMDVMNGGDQ